MQGIAHFESLLMKLELITTHKKNKILACKDFLKETEDYYNVRIQPDEPKRVRVGRAMIRQAANKARQEGKRVWQTHDTVEIDGEKFDINTIQTRDARMTKRRETHPHDDPTPTHFEKDVAGKKSKANSTDEDDHTKYAENLCTLDTPYGLAFFTLRSRLSNFYPCSILFNGRRYKSVEHGYQAEKAICANDQQRLNLILNATTAALAKDYGKGVASSVKWMHMKTDVMRKLLYAKFTQHPELGDYLCSTGGKNLIEGSTDNFWGAGVPLHSIEMKTGNWYGRNELGRLLKSVREELLQQRELANTKREDGGKKDKESEVNLITLVPASEDMEISETTPTKRATDAKEPGLLTEHVGDGNKVPPLHPATSAQGSPMPRPPLPPLQKPSPSEQPAEMPRGPSRNDVLSIPETDPEGNPITSLGAIVSLLLRTRTNLGEPPHRKPSPPILPSPTK